MSQYKTYEEIRNLFKRLALVGGFNEQWFETFSESHGLPFMIHYIVSQLWLIQAPETEDTMEFRKQVKHLNEHGCFNVLK